MTYYSFLKEQDAAFQDAVIGKELASQLREGALSAEAFNRLTIHQKFPPAPLEQLKADRELILNQPKG